MFKIKINKKGSETGTGMSFKEIIGWIIGAVLIVVIIYLLITINTEGGELLDFLF